MLFIDFEKGRRLRVNGVASIAEYNDLLEQYLEAHTVHRAGASARGIPELPALHPQVPSGGTLSMRAQGEPLDAGAQLETLDMGEGRPAC